MKVFLFSDKKNEIMPGWEKGVGDVIFESSRGQIVHVVVADDNGRPLYDQFLHYEPVGAISVPINTKGEYGLVAVERPTVQSSVIYQYPHLKLCFLGVSSLEFPRGFPEKEDGGEQTAKREGEEELGSPIISAYKIGELTPNTTFHPHKIPVFLVCVDEGFKGVLPPDVNEKIVKAEWFSEGEMDEIAAKGKIHCALTLAAYNLAKISRKKFSPAPFK